VSGHLQEPLPCVEVGSTSPTTATSREGRRSSRSSEAQSKD